MSPETEKLIQNPCSIKEAKGVLGEKNVFGPEEWKIFFGDKFRVMNIPTIPWSQTELTEPIQKAYKERHFLFLGLERLNDQEDVTLNLGDLKKVLNVDLLDQSKKPHIPDEFSVINQTHTQSRWYLIESVINLTRLSYDQQVKWLPNNYEVSSPAELILGNVLHHLLNGRFNIEFNTWIYTNLVREPYDFKVRANMSDDDDLRDIEFTEHAPRSYFAAWEKNIQKISYKPNDYMLFAGYQPSGESNRDIGTAISASLKLPKKQIPV